MWDDSPVNRAIADLPQGFPKSFSLFPEKVIDIEPVGPQQTQMTYPSSDYVRYPVPNMIPNSYLPYPSRPVASFPNGFADIAIPVHAWDRALDEMGILIDLARDLTKGEYSTLFYSNTKTNELYAYITYPDPIPIVIPSNWGIAGACFTTGQVINCRSAYTDRRFYSGIDRQIGGSPTRAILAVPVRFQDKIIGVIEVLNKKKLDFFTEENNRNLQVIATLIACVIERSTQNFPRNEAKRPRNLPVSI